MAKNYSKQAVIDRIAQERAEFISVLKQVSDSDYEVNGIIDDWSVKDLLGHLTAWEKQMVDWVEMARRGEKPDMPAPGNWDEYIQTFNQANYLAKREFPLAVILQEFDQVYASLLQALGGMPEDDAHPYWRVWWGGKPSWGFADTFAHHYAEHGEQLAAWLKNSS